MSTQTTTLNAIAIDVVGHYSQAAKYLVDAYRAGTQRVVTGLGSRFEQMLDGRSLPLVSDDMKAGIIGGEQRLAGFVTGSVDRVSERVHGGVERVSSRTVEGMAAVGRETAWASDLMVVNALRALHMPVAKVSLKIAGKVANASRRLSERVAGAEEAGAVAAAPTAKVAAKRAPRGSRKG